jgi:hypothetical protein
MAQESVRKRVPARVSRGIASTDELDPFQPDELLVGRAPEAMVLGHLPEEGDHDLGTVLVLVWQVDLVTKDHQPLAELTGTQDNTLWRFLVLAVVLESLQDQLGSRGRGKVDEDHFHVGEHLEGRHERHGLA